MTKSSSGSEDDAFKRGTVSEVWEELKENTGSESTMPFSRFMEIALYGADGYYHQRAKLGGIGADFYTSAHFPLFGRTLGKYIVDFWGKAYPTDPIRVVEMGPGQGELASAVCSYFLDQVDCTLPVHYILVERADHMKSLQQSRLAAYKGRVTFEWLDNDTELTDGPVVVIANELLDALPVECVKRTRHGWQQAFVQIDAKRRDLRMLWQAATPDVATVADTFLPVEVSGLGEVCLHYEEIFHRLLGLASEGHAVFVDYGSISAEWASGVRPSGTLRAYSRHQLVDPLSNPGLIDITADVNWDHFCTVGKRMGFAVHGLETQGSFLMRAGILQLAEATLTAAKRETITTQSMAAGPQNVVGQFKTLVLPGGLGERFSVVTCDWARGDKGEPC